MKLWQEKWYPIAAGTLVGVGFFIAQDAAHWSVPNTLPNLFSSVINVSAIAIGFLGAAQSILVSIEGKDVMLQLRESGALGHIADYLMKSVVWSFGLAALSVVLMFTDWNVPSSPAAGAAQAPAIQQFWFLPLLSIWVALLVTATLAYYRIIRLFAKILKLGSTAPS